MRIRIASIQSDNAALTLAALFLFFVSLPSSAEPSPEWEKALNEDGIKVLTRDVPGSPYKEYKGVTTVPASAASVMAIFTEPDTNREWLHGCTKVETIEHSGFHSITTCQVFDFPWPATDRDFVIDFEIKQTGENEFVMTMRDRSGQMPEKPDLVRARMPSGYYEIRQLSHDRTEIVMAQHVEPNGDLPGWMVNSLVTDTPYYSLKNLKGLVKKGEYSDAAFLRDEEGKVTSVAY